MPEKWNNLSSLQNEDKDNHEERKARLEQKENKLLDEFQILLKDRQELENKLADPTFVDKNKRTNFIHELEYIKSKINKLSSKLEDLQKELD